MSRRTVRRALAVALAAAVLIFAASDRNGAEGRDRAETRAALAAVDAAVARVERQAARSRGPAGERARALRQLLEKWHDTHVAVFAVDPDAARGRMQTVLDGLAAISPELVERDEAGRASQIDDDAVARALRPDRRTSELARREAHGIERHVRVLADLIAGQPASTVLFERPHGPGGGTVDDVLISLQERLQLLYPRTADRVMQLRVHVPR